MRNVIWLLAAIVVAQSVYASEEAAPPPWEVNRPIVDVSKEVYVAHPEPGVGAWVGVTYVGPSLTRQETHTSMSESDTPVSPKRRVSTDNGRTWSEFEVLPEIVSHQDGARIYWGSGPTFFDPEREITVSIWLRQTKVDGLYHNQCFSRFSRDLGRTWSEPRQIRYEEGEFLNLDKPTSPGFINNNQAYIGNNIIRHSNGTLIHCVVSTNVPNENPSGEQYHPWVSSDAKNIGSLCIVGIWNLDQNRYDWTPGKPVWVPLDVSSRGLMEPEVAELKNGRVLVIWRGSDTPVTQGRKWYSVSDDGGKTLSDVSELRYDDGSRFYSPSSIHRMIRHRVNGKLYWIGNISREPPKGNSPRYPLVIAEVDEDTTALKRNTVTVIDDRQPGGGKALQLSNFSVLQDRETHDLEVHLTPIGANVDDFSDWPAFWESDSYKYMLTFK